MDDDVGRGRFLVQISLQPVAFRAQFLAGGVQCLFVANAFHQQPGDVVQLLGDGFLASFGLGAAGYVLRRFLMPSFQPCPRVSVYLIGGSQFIGQRVDNKGLHVAKVIGLGVGTASRIGVSGTADALPSALVMPENGHARTTGGALDKARQQQLGAVLRPYVPARACHRSRL